MARRQKNGRRDALCHADGSVYQEGKKNWVKESGDRWFIEEKTLGSYVIILKELLKGTEKDVKSYIRIYTNTLKVSPFIGKDANKWEFFFRTDAATHFCSM